MNTELNKVARSEKENEIFETEKRANSLFSTHIAAKVLNSQNSIFLRKRIFSLLSFLSRI